MLPDLAGPAEDSKVGWRAYRSGAASRRFAWASARHWQTSGFFLVMASGLRYVNDLCKRASSKRLFVTLPLGTILAVNYERFQHRIVPVSHKDNHRQRYSCQRS